MKRASVVTVALLALLAMPVSAQQPSSRVITLDEALRTARENSPMLARAEADLSAARARVDEARAPLLPQVTGTGSYQRTTANFVARPSQVPSSFSTMVPSPTFRTFDFFNLGLTASQLLYDFGQTTGRYRAVRATERAQEWSARTTALDVEGDWRVAYFAACAARALVAVAEETVGNQERHLAQIEGFVRAGTRPTIDVAQARVNLANARLTLIQARNGYDGARAQLNQAIGVEASIDYDVADGSGADVVLGEERALDALVEESLGARPEFRALEEQARAQEYTIRATTGTYAPTLSASTSLNDAGRQLGHLSWNWNATVQLTWQLYQGGARMGQVAEMRAMLDSLEAQIASERLAVRLEVEQAALAVGTARSAVDAADEVVTNAQELLRLAEGRYANGAGSVIELGDAQLAFTNAEAQRVRAGFDLATARARLVRALGRGEGGS